MQQIDKSKLKCPTCGGEMTPAEAISGGFSTFWMRCASSWCRTFIDTYIPTGPQSGTHEDDSRYMGVFGGYGSGKTACGMKDDQKHILMTPRGTTVVGSAVLGQVEQTYEKDFVNDFPKEFLRVKNEKKKSYTFVNGHSLLIKSYYEPDVLRSLTVSRFRIVEASGVDHEIYVQLKTRLRDTSGGIPKLDRDGNRTYLQGVDGEIEMVLEADWRKGIAESNPDAGWIREGLLLQSGKIRTYGTMHKYTPINPDPNTSTHIFGTRSNPHLPPGFYAEQARNKPAWWVARYLEGSFDYAEGMVYPGALKSFIDPFEIPDHWKRIVAMDYGIRNDTALIYLAIDTKNKMVYAFDEGTINNVNYKKIAELYRAKEKRNIPIGTLLVPPVMDGQSINKRNDYDLRTIGDLFQEEGISFSPAKMNLDARISVVNDGIEAGWLKIFNTCKNLCTDLMKYKFPERTSDGKATSDKPVDKKNHTINALEFGVMEIPPRFLGIEEMKYEEKPKKEIRYNPYANIPPIRAQENNKKTGDFGHMFRSYKEDGSLW